MDGGDGEISVNPIRVKFLLLRNEGGKFRSFSLQKVGLEVVKCDKHSSLFSIRDAGICTRSRLTYRSRHGTEQLDLSM